MTEYVFSGKIAQGRETQPFDRTVDGESLEHAKENLYSTLCSEHSIKRTKIEVEKEKEA